VDTFVALRDFYESWPEFVTNNLYITGESYAGIYAPFLALQIHEWNQEVINSRGYANSMRKIYPLAGYIIGNGVTDWDFDGPPAYMEALFQNFRVNDTIYKEWNSLGCKYWYRNLKTKVNDPRCSDI
jgi:carboxypeptidase C (cathepsin A)